jgi:tRNA(Ile)-lysidine synthase
MPAKSINPSAAVLRSFPATRRHLVGISGGRDSVALLHWLIERGYENLVVCHLDHRLRGAASAADARFVEKLANQLGARFHSESIDVRALARKKKLSIEAAAREARYSFFAKIAAHEKCRTIFLGHHADDLVETFLINLFRGAGTAGLSAMREISTRQIARVNLTVVRPLLGVWRSEIEKYVRAHRLRFREDSSNRDLTPLRNRIRHRVIPYLEKTLDRKIRQNIWRTATIAAEEESFFATLLPDNLLNGASLAVEPLREMLPAMQRRTLHQWLRSAAVRDVGFDLVERVRALLDLSTNVAKVNLPRDRHVRRRAKKIFIEG